jgi:hypothetical protein
VKVENVNEKMGAGSHRLPEAGWDRVGVSTSFRHLRCKSSEPFERANGSLITDHHSLITVFLIDTPAIRIAFKSFSCITIVHSNRHSSGASNLHQIEAGSGGEGANFRPTGPAANRGYR